MIYFLRGEGSDLVKIGFTETEESLKRRIVALQTGHPWKLEQLRVIPEGGRSMESWFHRHFAKWHSHGEWFVYIPEMLTAYPPSPDFETRMRRKAAAREYLTDIIERLIDLVDYLTPDVDRETDLADWEPEAEMYFRTTNPREAARVTWDDCDQEYAAVPLEPEEGCEVTVPIFDPKRRKIMGPFGVEHTRVTRVTVDPSSIEDRNPLPSTAEDDPEGIVISTMLEFPVELEP